MYVDINPYDRSVTIDGVKVKEKVHSFPDKLNHLSTISCEYDAATDTITDVHNVHRYVSHFIAREYYYEHLKEFVDWYYLEQEAQLLAEDTEGFGKIVANGVTLDAEVQGDTLYLNAGEGIEITAEKEEASQAKVVKVTEKYIDVDQAENLNQISDKLRVGGLAVITNEEGTTFYKKEDDVTFKELPVKGVEKALFDLEEKVDNKANIALDNISKEALEAIAHAAMPSSSSIELSFPASGGTYTALADGYVHVRGTSTTLPAYLELVSGKLNVLSWSGNAGSATAVYIPVSKGQTITLRYTNHTLTVYRFVTLSSSGGDDETGHVGIY